MPGDIVLGAGITGMTIGITSDLPVYEARPIPGGLCASYYIGGFRFEVGGGHWIFGNGEGLSFLENYAEMKRYERRAGVFFPDQKCIVPYPIQDHRDEIPKLSARKDYYYSTSSMGEWLLGRFGADICNEFFFPFHEKYTAGLWRHIAPQNPYKSPTSGSGYNAEFSYPVDGLDVMIQSMVRDCDVRCGRKAVSVDIESRHILFFDGSVVEYDRLYSTIPLNKMMHMTGLSAGTGEDPHTFVNVLNIGGIRGPKCPEEHWLYVAQEDVPFYRIGVYSNVDASFVPTRFCVSFYVESALPQPEIETTIGLLRQWGFIEEVLVTSLTRIDVAYTWRWVLSSWRIKALNALLECGIYQIGRFGGWKFQGIAASVEEGLLCAECSK